MQIYRVCHRVEAKAQISGQPYVIPPSQKVVQSLNAGFHATLVPEYWRRILNHHMRESGLGLRYEYTLLLEIPDSIEPISNTPVQGYEYRLDSPDDVIVVAVAGSEWPAPDWVPQPPTGREYLWEPRSTKVERHVWDWKPRGPVPLN
jgi:hypothetical protein